MLPHGDNKHRRFYEIDIKRIKVKGDKGIKSEKTKDEEKVYQSIFIDIYEQQKAMTMVAVIIAILAVDFPEIFARELCKTEEFGVSLMDVGVSLITLNSGMSNRKARPWLGVKNCNGILKELFDSVVGGFVPVMCGLFRIVLLSDADY